MCVQVEGLGNPKKVEFHAGDLTHIQYSYTLLCNHHKSTETGSLLEMYFKLKSFAGLLYSLTCEDNQMLEMVECFINVFSYSW